MNSDIIEDEISVSIPRHVAAKLGLPLFERELYLAISGREELNPLKLVNRKEASKLIYPNKPDKTALDSFSKKERRYKTKRFPPGFPTPVFEGCFIKKEILDYSSLNIAEKKSYSSPERSEALTACLKDLVTSTEASEFYNPWTTQDDAFEKSMHQGQQNAEISGDLPSPYYVLQPVIDSPKRYSRFEVIQYSNRHVWSYFSELRRIYANQFCRTSHFIDMLQWNAEKAQEYWDSLMNPDFDTPASSYNDKAERLIEQYGLNTDVNTFKQNFFRWFYSISFRELILKIKGTDDFMKIRAAGLSRLAYEIDEGFNQLTGIDEEVILMEGAKFCFKRGKARSRFKPISTEEEDNLCGQLGIPKWSYYCPCDNCRS